MNIAIFEVARCQFLPQKLRQSLGQQLLIPTMGIDEDNCVVPLPVAFSSFRPAIVLFYLGH